MPKLQFEIGCVLCHKPVGEWTTVLTDTEKRFFAKCQSCGAMNAFSISNRIDLDKIPDYLQNMSVNSKLDIREVQRLENARRTYKIPEHIPLQQTYKYAKIKLDGIRKEGKY